NGKSKLNTIASNLIGTDPTGEIALGNDGDGIKLQTTERNLIGREDAVSTVAYYRAEDGADTHGATAWHGIRESDDANEYLIVGASEDDGLLYVGAIDGSAGTSYVIEYPDSSTTSAYGVDNVGDG